MHEAHVNEPVGHNYNAAFGTWLRRYGFETIDKGDRARLFEVMDKLVEIAAWRATLTESQRLLLNHPTAVLRRWRAATVIPNRNAPSKAPPAGKTGIAHATAADIVAAWVRAPRNECAEAIKRIGLEELWAVLPADWMPEIARRLADCAQDRAPTITTPVCAIPDYLSIPEFLLRERPNAVHIAPRPVPLLVPLAPISPEQALAPNADAAAVDGQGLDSDGAFGSELKEGAKPKCREAAEHAPEGAPETNRVRGLEVPAEALENLETQSDASGARDWRAPMNKRFDLVAFCGTGIPPLKPFSRGSFSYGYNDRLIIRINRRRNVPEAYNDSHLTEIDLDKIFEGIAQASFQLPPNFEPAQVQCVTCAGSGFDPDYPYRQYNCVACGGTGFDPVSVLLDGGLPFHLDSLLLINGLPAVEIAVVPEKRRLFFRFCGGDGALMSIIKRPKPAHRFEQQEEGAAERRSHSPERAPPFTNTNS
jgi:hypothetical protein